MHAWKALARTLRHLHRTLLQSAQADYVRDNALSREIGPGELLMLAITDGSFAWLRSLSELMADIDDLAEQKTSLDNDEARSAIRNAVEHLLSPPGSEQPSAFAERYWRYVHENPEIAMAHGAVKQELLTWPPLEKRDGHGLSKLPQAKRRKAE